MQKQKGKHKRMATTASPQRPSDLAPPFFPNPTERHNLNPQGNNTNCKLSLPEPV